MAEGTQDEKAWLEDLTAANTRLQDEVQGLRMEANRRNDRLLKLQEQHEELLAKYNDATQTAGSADYAVTQQSELLYAERQKYEQLWHELVQLLGEVHQPKLPLLNPGPGEEPSWLLEQRALLATLGQRLARWQELEELFNHVWEKASRGQYVRFGPGSSLEVVDRVLERRLPEEKEYRVQAPVASESIGEMQKLLKETKQRAKIAENRKDDEKK